MFEFFLLEILVEVLGFVFWFGISWFYRWDCLYVRFYLFLVELFMNEFLMNFWLLLGKYFVRMVCNGCVYDG